MKHTQEVSKDKKYCYAQVRSWGDRKRSILFIGLHATWYNAPHNSPMLTRCIMLAKSWGYTRVILCNLYGLRVSEPHDLMDDMDTVGIDNDSTLQIFINNADTVVCTWGVNGYHQERDRIILDMIPKVKRYCIGTTRARNDPKQIVPSTPIHTDLIIYEKNIMPVIKIPKQNLQDKILSAMHELKKATVEEVHKELPHISYRGIQAALYKLAYNDKLIKSGRLYELVDQTSPCKAVTTEKATVIYDAITHYNSVDVYTLSQQIQNINISEIEQICDALTLQKRLLIVAESPTQPIKGRKMFLYSINRDHPTNGGSYIKAPRKPGMQMVAHKDKKIQALNRAIKRACGIDQDILINILGDIESG